MKESKLSAALSAILLCTSFCGGAFADNSAAAVSVYKGGKPLTLGNSAFIQNETVYLPLRELLDNLSDSKIEIVWNDDKSIVLNGTFAKTADETVPSRAEFRIGSNELKITRGEKAWEFALSQPAILLNNRTYVSYDLAVILNANLYPDGGFETVIAADEMSENELNRALIWADALKTRDGKPRYDIMTEDMQNKFIEDQKALINDNENWNYTIGFSSPHVVSYDVAVSGNTAYISYHLTDSSNESYIVDEELTFDNKDNTLYVSDCKTLE